MSGVCAVDIGAYIALQDLDTISDSPVTSIASDVGSSSTFLASFADGAVKLFDRRLEEDDAVVRTFHDHSSWIQNVKWHPNFGWQFVSGRYDLQTSPKIVSKQLICLAWMVK